MRFPQDTYAAIKSVLGKSFDHPMVEEYRNTFTNTMVEDKERRTVGFSHNSTLALAAEELAAMLLAHTAKLATKHAGVAVSGVVITVPPYFTHFERQAIMDAADIAGVAVMGLVNDETAVAVNFGLGKRFPEKKYHILYDMGAGSTVASLVSFQTEVVKSLGRNRTKLCLEVVGMGFDESLGGHTVDVLLRNYLAKLFMDKHKGSLGTSDISNDPRALARLLKEANRVKQILSANQNTYASVENLFEGLDFRVMVSRAELEDLAKDLVSRVAAPVHKVLQASNKTLNDIESLVLVGGGVRIPAIQSALVQTVGDDKIARNVDGDEAAVLGAVFQAASISVQFRLGTDLKIKDINYVPIQLDYESDLASGDGSVSAVLFNETAALGSKKRVKIHRKTDFWFALNYNKDGAIVPIANVSVNGLTKVLQEKAALNFTGVKAHIELSESGIVSVKDVYALFDEEVQEKPPSLGQRVMDFLSSNKNDGSDSESAGDNDGASAESSDDDSASGNTADAAKLAAKDAKSTKEAKKPKLDKLKLPFNITWLTTTPMTSQQKAESKKRLLIMDNEDIQRANRDEARNKLETYLYKCKEFTWDDDAVAYATEAELEALKATISEQNDWLEDNSETATKDAFVSKRGIVEKSFGKIEFRINEVKKRPKSLKELEEAVKKAASKIAECEKAVDSDGELLFKATEITTQRTFLDLSSKTLEDAKTKLKDLPLNQDPEVTVEMIDQATIRLRGVLFIMDPLSRKASAEKAKLAQARLKSLKDKSTSSASKYNSTSVSGTVTVTQSTSKSVTSSGTISVSKSESTYQSVSKDGRQSKQMSESTHEQKVADDGSSYSESSSSGSSSEEREEL